LFDFIKQLLSLADFCEDYIKTLALIDKRILSKMLGE